MFVSCMCPTFSSPNVCATLLFVLCICRCDRSTLSHSNDRQFSIIASAHEPKLYDNEQKVKEVDDEGEELGEAEKENIHILYCRMPSQSTLSQINNDGFDLLSLNTLCLVRHHSPTTPSQPWKEAFSSISILLYFMRFISAPLSRTHIRSPLSMAAFVHARPSVATHLGRLASSGKFILSYFLFFHFSSSKCISAYTPHSFVSNRIYFFLPLLCSFAPIFIFESCCMVGCFLVVSDDHIVAIVVWR